jgi:hypothetical protein
MIHKSTLALEQYKVMAGFSETRNRYQPIQENRILFKPYKLRVTNLDLSTQQ